MSGLVRVASAPSTRLDSSDRADSCMVIVPCSSQALGPLQNRTMAINAVVVIVPAAPYTKRWDSPPAQDVANTFEGEPIWLSGRYAAVSWLIWFQRGANSAGARSPWAVRGRSAL